MNLRRHNGKPVDLQLQHILLKSQFTNFGGKSVGFV